MLSCDHHYCRRCGTHKSYTVELSHTADCPLLESEQREAAQWAEYRQRIERSGDNG
jgi:ribosomal protein L37E